MCNDTNDTYRIWTEGENVDLLRKKPITLAKIDKAKRSRRTTSGEVE
jgi:hypothetical protein